MKDFLNDSDGDILIENGDLVIGDSDEQHIDDILQTNQGEWCENLLLGFGIMKYKNAPKSIETEFTADMKRALKFDGFNLKVKLKEGLKDFEIS